jgi:hypothetical protein
MPDASLPVDHTAPIEVNFVARSPHVVAYRLWRQLTRPDGPWAVLGDGHTADHVPDLVQVSPSPVGSRLAYWVAIGGNPNTQYQVLVTIAQNGKIVPGGTLLVNGRTNEKGVAEDHGFIDLI